MQDEKSSGAINVLAFVLLLLSTCSNAKAENLAYPEADQEAVPSLPNVVGLSLIDPFGAEGARYIRRVRSWSPSVTVGLVEAEDRILSAGAKCSKSILGWKVASLALWSGASLVHLVDPTRGGPSNSLVAVDRRQYVTAGLGVEVVVEVSRVYMQMGLGAGYRWELKQEVGNAIVVQFPIAALGYAF